MSKSDDDFDRIEHVIGFLRDSEYGSDDYNMAYKTMIKLFKEETDMYWEHVSTNFLNKQESVYYSIIDKIIFIGFDDEEYDCGATAEDSAKFIKADNQFVEYCKAQVGINNSYDFPIKAKFEHKLKLIGDAIKICENSYKL